MSGSNQTSGVSDVTTSGEGNALPTEGSHSPYATGSAGGMLTGSHTTGSTSGTLTVGSQWIGSAGGGNVTISVEGNATYATGDGGIITIEAGTFGFPLTGFAPGDQIDLSNTTIEGSSGQAYFVLSGNSGDTIIPGSGSFLSASPSATLAVEPEQDRKMEAEARQLLDRIGRDISDLQSRADRLLTLLSADPS
jgi:hypothetical protein